MSNKARDVVERLREMRALYVESKTWKANSPNAAILTDAIAVIEAQALVIERPGDEQPPRSTGDEKP